MLTLATTDHSDNGKRHTEETKELAYQLWAFGTMRNASEVSRQLSSGEYAVNDPPSQQAIAYWSREYKWAERAKDEVHAIAPDLRYQVFSEMLFAGVEGVKYLRQVISGQTEACKVRTQASIAIIDRIGFSPIGKGAPGIEKPSNQDEGIATLTDEDLEIREALIGVGRVSRS